jgi:DNA-binding XRE family transcriptional regulator
MTTTSPPPNRLRELRRRRQLAVWGLAARARTSPTLISAIERWGYVPGVDVRTRIAAALGVVVNDVWPDAAEDA